MTAIKKLHLATLFPATPRRWGYWALAIVAADLLWFCSMYPLVPRSVFAAVLEAFLPVPLLLYIYVALRVLFWVANRPWAGWLRQSATAILALAIGALGIWMVDWTVIHTSAEYGYQTIRNL